MTEAESVLWQHIKGKALGVKFLRQHIIGDYIVDFITFFPSHCSPPSGGVEGGLEGLGLGLIIEVDGGYHSERQQQEDDAIRQQWLEQQGYKVIRFSNEQILFDTENSLSLIKQILSYLPLQGD